MFFKGNLEFAKLHRQLFWPIKLTIALNLRRLPLQENTIMFRWFSTLRIGYRFLWASGL
jgi:hypothetical protein